MDPNNSNDKPAKKKTKDEVIKELEELVKEPGFIYSFALVLRRDLFLDPAKSADINWNEKISFQEASFLMGLMVKYPISLELPHPDAVESHISAIEGLFESLHQAHIQPIAEAIFKDNDKKLIENPEDTYLKLFGNGETMTEPIFYSGSGAYDFQYLDFAKKRYQNDADWLQKNKNVSIDSLVKIASLLKKKCQEKMQNVEMPKGLEKLEDFVLLYITTFDIFCFEEKDLDFLTKEEMDSLLKNFSVVAGNANQELKTLGDYNQVISHPIIDLGNGKYFFPIGFNLPQSIYESPFYWMASDENYKQTAFKNSATSAENISFEMMESVFGVGNVYKDVIIKKNKQTAVTDIDVLAIAGNKAIVVQVKSKKLTQLSRKGNEEQLRKDFGTAVQEAYQQGLVSRVSILNKENTLEHNGKQIVLDESINEVYILCVTLDHYPAVTSQVDVYLEKTDTDPYPIAISIFDLEILAFYLKDPFEFLYYVRQRVALYKYYRASSEVVLLGAHLRRKLSRRPDVDGEALDGSFAQLIDANFPAMKGHVPMTKAVERLHHKWKNADFNKLVARVKESAEPNFTDAIFFLYDLSSDSADNLITNIKKAKEKCRRDGQQHDFSLLLADGKGGTSFMCFPDYSDDIESRLMTLGVARKYKTKADIWLALGSISGSPEIFDAMAFNKEPWVEDPELDEFSKIALKTGTPISIKSGKKLGRNEPCHCGSGKKYKKCHLL